MIAKHQLGGIDRLDLLAGTFVELGKREDAYAINQRALQADRIAVYASSCRRLARAIVLAPADLREGPLEDLRVLTQGDKPDRLCVELHQELACWVYMTRAALSRATGQLAHCGPYWHAQGIPAQLQGVVEAYVQWPQRGAYAREWFIISDRAANALAVEGADEIAIRALEAAVRSEQCLGPQVKSARMLAQRILHEPTRKKTVDDARIRRLIDQPAQLCAH